jgi:5-methylcytosine-specific restriction endonuclease McrA
MNYSFDNDAISFAERVLTLLDQGSYVSTYKYAVLLGIMDVVMERAGKSGMPPQTITTTQLANKVIEIYWPHTNSFYANKSDIEILRQSTGGQAEIISLISHFRQHPKVGNNAPLFMAKYRDPSGFQKLVNRIEWKLIKMPLPKLQRIGNTLKEFIFHINWDDSVNQRPVSDYQNDRRDEFDNQIYLQHNVGEYLVRLNSLLRPLIQREWSRMVADINELEEAKLQHFLFDAERAGAARLCKPLCELQNDLCFYCGHKMGNNAASKPEVDHFIAWARYPNDSLANYVVAHKKCNGHKRDHLAASDHVMHWYDRLFGRSPVLSDLEMIANTHHWDLGEQSSVGVVATIYKHLKPEVELWKIDDEFEMVDIEKLSRIFWVSQVA